MSEDKYERNPTTRYLLEEYRRLQSLEEERGLIEAEAERYCLVEAEINRRKEEVWQAYEAIRHWPTREEEQALIRTLQDIRAFPDVDQG